MPSLKERVTARVDRARERSALLDHLIRTGQHYSKVNANALAGAVTYFGFLSFFPILALSFFFVGQLSKVYDEARSDLIRVIDSFLPGIVGNGEGEIRLSTFEPNAAAVGILGLICLLYTGLGWLSGMRDALQMVFETPQAEQPNFVVGKLRDVGFLLFIGAVLLVSVALSSLIAGFSQDVLDLFGLENTPVTAVVLWLVVHGLGIAATTVLFLVMFRLLANPQLPRRSMLYGALLGGIGFELLKALSVYLIGITRDQPAFQAFGIALILLVWINYFSRVVMLSAAFAYTSPAAVELRLHESTRAPGAAFGTPEETRARAVDPAPAPLTPAAPSPVTPLADELVVHRAAGHQAAAAEPRSRLMAGLAALGAGVAGLALLVWRRSTR